MAKEKRSKTQHAPPSKKKNGGGALSELRELYEFMQANSLHAVEFDKKDYHVRLVRKGRATVPVPVPVPVQESAQPAPAGAASAPTPVVAPDMPPNAYVIRSPMMGIFYRAASPSSPPFCKEGDIIKTGDVICLIEAMKVFNDVKADAGGILRRVLIEDGKSVKVGQELFVLERK